ncbi:hypothetical protein MACK_003511 [Theileria orientalis]|uniref:Uncharacterized protein n=1 Tax=Theileria orientalis TaxID=68886 RepID=A0A976SJ90_THEOR|nr:hypothetical protein MACK_003511 [Theileria orientalis]
MAEVSKKSHIVLIHEIVKYHIRRSSPDLLLVSKTNSKGLSHSVTHSSIINSLEDQGYYLGSRIVSRLTIGKGRIWDPNKCMIFICRELWIYLFGKQAKRLQSNSQGIYIVFSDELYWLENLQFSYKKHDDPSENPSFEEYKDFYLSFISGVLRGSLKSLGFACSVTGEYNIPCMPFIY